MNEADQWAKFSSIGGYRNVINNSNRFLLTKLYTKVLTKAVTYYCLDHINLKKVKQNNGKENVISDSTEQWK